MEGNEMAFRKDSTHQESILGLLREDEEGVSNSMVKINLEKQRVVTKDQERLLFLGCVKEFSNIVDIAFMSQNVFVSVSK